jgi:cysteine-rich repeat protein
MHQALLITLSLVLVSVAPVCGNGVLEGSEQCDDGNLVTGDGCSATCQLETYYRCDNSLPNICKIDAVVSLRVVGIRRFTSANLAVILLQPNYDIPPFRTISFTPIFSTSIPSSGFLVEYTW